MTTKNILKCDSVTAVRVSQFQKICLLNFWFHKSINKVKRLLCDTCHKSRWFMALENEPKVIIWEGTVWQLSQCHTFLPSDVGFVPKIPNPLCSIVSVSIPIHPKVRKKNKSGYFIMEISVFSSETKNAQNAIFQFSTWFLKTFPSTEMGPLYLKKKLQTFLYQNIPQPAQLAHPRPSNSPRKV